MAVKVILLTAIGSTCFLYANQVLPLKLSPSLSFIKKPSYPGINPGSDGLGQIIGKQ